MAKKRNMPSETAVKATQILGKKVLSSEGNKIGELGEIFIDPDKMRVEGITVSRGIFSNDFYIDSGYLERIEREAVLLNMIPAHELINRDIVDADGHKIGKVKEVKREGQTNEVISFVVKRGLRKNDLMIATTNVDRIGENIVLTRNATATMEA